MTSLAVTLDAQIEQAKDDQAKDDLVAKQKQLNDLNLNFLSEALIKRHGWSRKDAEESCKMYKNYLFLKLKYGDQYMLPPSVEIDDVWHLHILYTEKYTSHCQSIFGFYLHHIPGSSNASEAELEKFAKQFSVTEKLYLKEFGEPIKMTKGFKSRFGIAWKEFFK